MIGFMTWAADHGAKLWKNTGVTGIRFDDKGTFVVETARGNVSTKNVVNCAGAWAGQIGPLEFPTRPIKGQMLVVAAHGLVRHVIRARHVYVVPRSNGRVLIGSTLEDVGFDKRVDPETLQRLHQAAANLAPQIGEARILEDWAGLRPATPDGLPMLGPTAVQGYFVAAGHYRDGILLAPITASLMAGVIRGRPPEFDLSPFSPTRFS
jgi:glycine oxidase